MTKYKKRPPKNLINIIIIETNWIEWALDIQAKDNDASSAAATTGWCNMKWGWSWWRSGGACEVGFDSYGLPTSKKMRREFIGPYSLQQLLMTRDESIK
jgi:hypothetical protein